MTWYGLRLSDRVWDCLTGLETLQMTWYGLRLSDRVWDTTDDLIGFKTVWQGFRHHRWPDRVWECLTGFETVLSDMVWDCLSKLHELSCTQAQNLSGLQPAGWCWRIQLPTLAQKASGGKSQAFYSRRNKHWGAEALRDWRHYLPAQKSLT